MATNTENQVVQTESAVSSKLMMTPSPHVKDSINTQKVMLTVAIALLPSLLAALYYFSFPALVLVATCVISCVVFEQLFFFQHPVLC